VQYLREQRNHHSVAGRKGAAGMTITRIIPEIRSRDLAATRDFYGTLLGLAVDMEDQDFLMFSSPANPSAQIIVNDNGCPGLPPGFAVDLGSPARVQALYDEVVRRGLPIVEPLADKPWGIRRFSVIDPNGARVTIISHIEGSPDQAYLSSAVDTATR
jgi:catechol 2,3-dioxygenase-like lactoylglutathione lyase family enzyme